MIGKDNKVSVPAEGLSATCVALGVVVVPEPQEKSEAEYYADMYVDDILNLEAWRGNFGRRMVGRRVSGRFTGFMTTVGGASWIIATYTAAWRLWTQRRLVALHRSVWAWGWKRKR